MAATAFVTFYDPYPDLQGPRLSLSNGFSFVRHLLPPGADVIVRADLAEADALRERLAPYARVFCTVAAVTHVQLVSAVADARWVLGGPLADWCAVPGATVVSGAYEAWVGQPLSARFGAYWDEALGPLGLPVTYACSLGLGCYWHRCTFCGEPHNRPPRPDRWRTPVAPILRQLPAPTHPLTRAHLCCSSVPPEILADVLRAERPSGIELYVRADAATSRVFEAYRGSLAGLDFHVGLEAFCDGALRLFRKGFTVHDVLTLLADVTSRGATARVTVMSGHPFLTAEWAEESLANVEALTRIEARNPGRMLLVDCGPTGWPRAALARRFSANVAVVSANRGRWRRYLAPLDPDSEATTHNRRIAERLLASPLSRLGTFGA